MKVIKAEDAEMERMAREQGLELMKPGLGTRPRVWYRNLWRYSKCFIGGSVSGADERRHGRLRRGRNSAADQGRRLVAETASDNYGDFKFDRLNENSGDYIIEVSVVGSPRKLVTAKLGASINLGEIRL